MKRKTKNPLTNESMLSAADSGVEKFKLEDGHFELDEKANPELLDALSTGEKGSMR